MILTPSNTGSATAGVGVGVFTWGAFLKSDHIPWLKKFMTTRRKEATLIWINKNKGISLLGLETVNFSIHGITSANSVMLALGNTILNIFMLWVFLPFRMIGVTKKHTRSVLKGAS